MNKLTAISLFVVALSGCTSHQYDGMQMQDADDGANYRLNDETLTIQYQEYQFFPDTTVVLIKCRETSKRIAKELNVQVKDFDYVTERNALLGITSCLAFGEREEK